MQWCYADAFDDAERASSVFISKYDSIRKIKSEEQKALVKAVCEAEEDSRRSVLTDVGNRVRRELKDAVESFSVLRDNALTKIAVALSDQQFKDKFEKLNEYKNRIDVLWSRANAETASVRGSDNPVLASLSRIGQEAHAAYQANSSNCTVSEWTLPGGKRVDCLKASTCEAIEVKPNNSTSVDRGISQANNYVRLLSRQEEMNRLIGQYPAFKECKDKGFTARVACYYYCPDIDDNGEMRSASVGWTMCK